MKPYKSGVSSHRVEFVSYNGKYPNLCSGVLVLKVGEKLFEFESHALRSGGGTNWRKETTTEGPWTISSFPDDFPDELMDEAVAVVNENVSLGCCGGCI